MKNELDPWRVIYSCLAEMPSRDIPIIIDRTGLKVNWSLSENEDRSTDSRKATYRPRIHSAYDTLVNEERIRVAESVARQIMERSSEISGRLTETLNSIGWRLKNGRLFSEARQPSQPKLMQTKAEKLLELLSTVQTPSRIDSKAGELLNMMNKIPSADPKGDEVSFMKEAITLARMSQPEDTRPHPRVGVVIVKNGSVVGKAYRGELGPGEHAEYTATERKLKNAALVGATVYTTLEPCIDRHHPKVPCADRLCERKVGKVVIGMVDPSIRGKGITRLRERNIAIEFFPEKLMAEIEELNREYLRAQLNGGKGSAPDLKNSLERILIRNLPAIAEVAGVPIGEIGLHVWLARKDQSDASSSLIRAARLRLSDSTPSKPRAWQRGEGVVGICWGKQTDIAIDLTDQIYINMTEDRWSTYDADTTLGQNFLDFRNTTKHFKSVCASPIVPEDEAVGCVSLNFDRESVPQFNQLWSRDVKNLLRRTAADVAFLLSQLVELSDI